MAATRHDRSVETCESCGQITSPPDPRTTPLLLVEEAGTFLGVSRTKAYTEVQRYFMTNGREGLPAVRFGRMIRVPLAELYRLIGLDPQPASINASPTDGGKEG